VAERGLGTLGRDVTSLIDSGAAAQSAAIAAASMGLGTCFTKSYSEVGMRRVLDIPDTFRTDVLLQVGYPAKDGVKTLKRREGGAITYLNRHEAALA